MRSKLGRPLFNGRWTSWVVAGPSSVISNERTRQSRCSRRSFSTVSRAPFVTIEDE
jgi:hypothetical protein